MGVGVVSFQSGLFLTPSNSDNSKLSAVNKRELMQSLLVLVVKGCYFSQPHEFDWLLFAWHLLQVFHLPA